MCLDVFGRVTIAERGGPMCWARYVHGWIFIFDIEAVRGHRVSITSEVGYLQQKSRIWWAPRRRCLRQG